MIATADTERCSKCHHDLGTLRETGYGALRISENDKEITLLHCPVCGSLLIHVETVPAESR